MKSLDVAEIRRRKILLSKKPASRRLDPNLLKKKKRLERSHPPISEERRIGKRILLKLAEGYSSKDETFAIVAKPMNATTPAAKPVTRPSKPV